MNFNKNFNKNGYYKYFNPKKKFLIPKYATAKNKAYGKPSSISN